VKFRVHRLWPTEELANFPQVRVRFRLSVKAKVSMWLGRGMRSTEYCLVDLFCY